jgi:hypothetical protein
MPSLNALHLLFQHMIITRELPIQMLHVFSVSGLCPTAVMDEARKEIRQRRALRVESVVRSDASMRAGEGNCWLLTCCSVFSVSIVRVQEPFALTVVTVMSVLLCRTISVDFAPYFMRALRTTQGYPSSCINYTISLSHPRYSQLQEDRIVAHENFVWEERLLMCAFH